MATNQEKLDNINHRANWMFEKLVGQIREAILWTSFDTAGIVGKTSLGNEIRWMASNFNRLSANDAQVKNLISALGAVSKGEPFDEAKLLAGVKAAAEAGTAAAIKSIDTTVTFEKES